jgi:hypothetical protein
MWTGKEIAAGCMAIICTTTTRIAACRCFSSARSSGSASWHSASAIIGAATIGDGPGTAARTIGCIGRRRRAIRGLRRGPVHRVRSLHHVRHGLIRRRDRGRRWSGQSRADPECQAVVVPRGPIDLHRGLTNLRRGLTHLRRGLTSARHGRTSPRHGLTSPRRGLTTIRRRIGRRAEGISGTLRAGCSWS